MYFADKLKELKQEKTYVFYITQEKRDEFNHPN